MARTQKKITKYYKKTRWASNIKEFNVEQITAAASSTFFAETTLLTNPIQDPNTISQQYTAKNIEATFEFEKDDNSDSHLVECITAYIMYVPQGMNITVDYNIQHPEYIMTYKFIGSPQTDAYNISKAYPTRVRTRLSRRLNTGDKIILFIKGKNEKTNPITIKVNGLVRWWTKAN